VVSGRAMGCKEEDSVQLRHEGALQGLQTTMEEQLSILHLTYPSSSYDWNAIEMQKHIGAVKELQLKCTLSLRAASEAFEELRACHTAKITQLGHIARDFKCQNSKLEKERRSSLQCREQLTEAKKEASKKEKVIGRRDLEIRTLKMANIDSSRKLRDASKKATEAQSLFQAERGKSKKAHSELEKTKKEAVVSIACLNKEIKTIKLEKENFEKAVRQLSSEKKSDEGKLKDVVVLLETERSLHKQSKEQQKMTENKLVAVSEELKKCQAVLETSRSTLLLSTERMNRMDEKQEAQNRQNLQERERLQQQVQSLSSKVNVLQVETTNSIALLTEKDRSLQRMQEELTDMKSTVTTAQEGAAKLRAEAISSREECVKQSSMREQLQQQLEDLQKEHIATAAQLQSINYRMKLQTAEQAKAKSDHEASLQEHMKSMEETASEKQALREENARLKSEVRTLQLTSHTSSESPEMLAEFTRANAEVEVLRKKVADLELDRRYVTDDRLVITELEKKVQQGESLRRKMHNTIQELRGNVRVFARIRPFLPDDNENEYNAVKPVGDGQGVDVLVKPVGNEKAENLSFSFDKVFAPSDSQEAVFLEVEEFVQSALDGFNVCLFSYGQTGSGKTHTMQGSGNGPMRGIISRSVETVLEQSQVLRDQGWTYEMEVTFVEIYNETIRDLLVEGNVEECDVKNTSKGSVHVHGAVKEGVSNLEMMNNILQRAAKNRSVAKTGMNAVSSRSHSIFTLHLTGSNETNGLTLEGKLNLCDLAGSERLSRSHASGQQLKETQHINKSLSALTDVFAAIRQKNSHIPFRNSKLTYLLQNCLCGDGKTLMLVNLSPTVASRQESICSLRFAQHVNKCELGKAKRQVQKRGHEKGVGSLNVGKPIVPAKGRKRETKRASSSSNVNDPTTSTEGRRSGMKRASSSSSASLPPRR